MPPSDGKSKSGLISKAQLGLYWELLPKVPLVVRVALLHVLKMSDAAHYLDLRSDVTISVLRSLLDRSKPRGILKTQAMTLSDPGVRGRIWISTVASKVPPEQGLRDALLAAISDMGDAGTKSTSFRIPDIVPIEAEWTGYRAAATPESTPPPMTEEQKYHEMMKECKNSTTVLYFHGGAYYLCDPSTHRPLCKKLAKLTGGRVYSVRYRLAPQHPFPSAVLDALVSYFTLLYPPPGSVHEAVAPGDIVFGGDSAGGNLTLSLLQTLLHFRRHHVKIPWFGEEREVPLPAAVTANSPWLDLVQSMPSWTTNQKWDYLPPAKLLSSKQPPADEAWPAKPPRKHIYIDDAYMLHPLASLHLSKSWEGAPPIYICCGWECLADEDKYLASKLTKDGVTVVFEEYEAMPHVFASILTKLPESRRNLDGWTQFITAACKDPESIKSTFTSIKAKTLEEVEIDIKKLTPFSEEDVSTMAYERIGRKAPLPEAAPML
ncbi:Uu.00g126930.m01.CDS01 [Anthostomella pinea]|uniref:Uu.00g126930.m01.CDS01 n=1 Tax=Anthostomella pinea TaxID=933095 RepID=A0AAI8VHZ7_9PEZI|nr:Uu.00g126930.m01.CDS01 [Anthostomella pinea]